MPGGGMSVSVIYVIDLKDVVEDCKSVYSGSIPLEASK